MNRKKDMHAFLFVIALSYKTMLEQSSPQDAIHFSANRGEPTGILILGCASHLDAFSVYRYRT